MATAGTFMRFTREAEREADRLGVENVVAAGYDPHGMITFFEKLGALRDGQANAVERFLCLTSGSGGADLEHRGSAGIRQRS